MVPPAPATPEECLLQQIASDTSAAEAEHDEGSSSDSDAPAPGRTQASQRRRKLIQKFPNLDSDGNNLEEDGQSLLEQLVMQPSMRDRYLTALKPVYQKFVIPHVDRMTDQEVEKGLVKFLNQSYGCSLAVLPSRLCQDGNSAHPALLASASGLQAQGTGANTQTPNMARMVCRGEPVSLYELVVGSVMDPGDFRRAVSPI